MYIQLLLILLSIIYLYPFSQSEASCGSSSPLKVRAVSLNSLQDKLKASQKVVHSSTLLQLAGINKIIGYIEDEQNRDIIIIGEVNSNLPSLYLEDFVVALRNAYLKYAPLENNVYQYSFPGCSIDPNPNVVKELQLVGQNIVGSSNIQATEKAITNWNKICNKSQDVRVLGIPFNTGFAKVMVEADYDMKSIVDGSAKLDISGFKSLTEMTLEKVSDDVLKNRPISISLSMNRFWFYPSINKYEESSGMVLIQQSLVSLLTNETYLNKSDHIVDAAGTNPQAKVFAENFSLLYKNIAQERHIYLKLENLFRFVALANIIKYKYPDLTNKFNLTYLLEKYPVKNTIVKKQLPGRSSVKRVDHRNDFEGGYQITQLRIPTCGGVDSAIKIGPNNFKHSSSQEPTRFKSTILNSRPKDAVFWDFDNPSDPYLNEYRDTVLLQEINSINESSSAIIVQRRNIDGYENYLAIDGDSEIYRGRDSVMLLENLTKKLNSEKEKKVYITVKSFPNEQKIQTFSHALKKELSNKNIKTKMEVISENDDNVKLEILFLPGAKMIEKTAPEKQNGMFRAIIRFTGKIGKEIINVTVYVFAKTAIIANHVITRIEQRLTDKPLSLIDNLNKTRKEIAKENGLSEDDIQLKIEVECRGVSYVIRINPKDNNGS
jgi:hypothetical protein